MAPQAPPTQTKHTAGRWAQVKNQKMNIRSVLLMLILGIINTSIQSCNNNKTVDKHPVVMELVKNIDSARIWNSDYKQLIGKTGFIDIVIIDVDYTTSIAHSQDCYNLGLKFNSIKIPFHNTPIIMTDSVAIITNPRIFFSDTKTLIVIRYQKGIFNFCKGGDNIDIYSLKDNDKISIKASLRKDLVLYEIKNNPFSIIGKTARPNDSGQYIMDYKGLIDKRIEICEKHNISFIKKFKYRIYEIKGGD
jgi:hypothetical protein